MPTSRPLPSTASNTATICCPMLLHSRPPLQAASPSDQPLRRRLLPPPPSPPSPGPSPAPTVCQLACPCLAGPPTQPWFAAPCCSTAGHQVPTAQTGLWHHRPSAPAQPAHHQNSTAQHIRRSISIAGQYKQVCATTSRRHQPYLQHHQHRRPVLPT
jgi:hypothetical protein